MDDLTIPSSSLPDEVRHMRIGGLHLPEDDPEAFSHDVRDLGIKCDHVNVPQRDR